MRREVLTIVIASLPACQPPVTAQQPSALPEPGVYVLKRARGMPLPADLIPGGMYDRFERVLGGWLYLMPNKDYKTVICADLVDTAGRVLNSYDGGLGGVGNKYWLSGGRVYFSDVIADGPLDSTAVRVHGDTVEFVPGVFVRDRNSVLPPYPPITAAVCPAVRAPRAHQHSTGHTT